MDILTKSPGNVIREVPNTLDMAFPLRGVERAVVVTDPLLFWNASSRNSLASSSSASDKEESGLLDVALVGLNPELNGLLGMTVLELNEGAVEVNVFDPERFLLANCSR